MPYTFIQSTTETAPDAEFLAFPVAKMAPLVKAYVAAIELERTDKWCRCEWKIHPDDMEKPEGSRRRARGQQAWDCPVHTKEGFLLYFFQWAMDHPEAGEHVGNQL